MNIPIIDFSDFAKNKNTFVATLGKGYEEFGFCGITNHGISDEIISNAYNVFKQFFDLAKSDKMKYNIEGNAFIS